MTLVRAVSAGFRAHEPIESFLNKIHNDSHPLRTVVREEEALELLGSISDWPFFPSSGEGVTLYRSPVVEELRLRQREDSASFRQKSHQEEVAMLVRDPDFPKVCELAQARLAFEAAEMVLSNDHVCSIDSERNPLRKMLTRTLARIEFKRASVLDKHSHISYRRDLGSATLLFAVDAMRPMQNRCVIAPSHSIEFDLFKGLNVTAVDLRNTSFALMAGGRPYNTPYDRSTLEVACELYTIALQVLSEKIAS